MARLEVAGGELAVRLSELEKLEAVHGQVAVPVTAVSTVRVAPDPWTEVRGLRAPGTGWPGRILVGTLRGDFGRDFVVIHGHEPAVVVELEGSEWARLVVTSPDADAVADGLRRQLPG
ncbi:MAG TPA: hypothetical protein VK277_03230 [Acidimicrobiales bacterium]|nr:hypothetical protein [Acidimicrobiales bacterium]